MPILLYLAAGVFGVLMSFWLIFTALDAGLLVGAAVAGCLLMLHIAAYFVARPFALKRKGALAVLALVSPALLLAVVIRLAFIYS